MKLNKHITQYLKKLIFAFAFTVSIAFAFGQNPPPPPGGGGSTGTNNDGNAVGGSGNSGTGIVLMTVFVLAYGAKRFYDYRKAARQEILQRFRHLDLRPEKLNGGGAPSGSGLLLLASLGVAYGLRKWYVYKLKTADGEL